MGKVSGMTVITSLTNAFKLMISRGSSPGDSAAITWQNVVSQMGTDLASMQMLPVNAGAMVSRVTLGAASNLTELATNKIMLDSFDFDQSTEEYVQFLLPMPKSWNEGTITVEFIWTAAAGAGDVIWGIQGLAIGNDDALDAAFGTAVEITDTLILANDLHNSAITAAMTFSGTPVENDVAIFQIYRKAGSDTLTADAQLLAVKLFVTFDSLNDL